MSRSLKPASAFAPARELQRKRREQLDPRARVWRMVRSPFLLPRDLEGHACSEWEVFDADLAGCLECGAVHRCSDEGTCPVAQESDSQVCTITGTCVKHKFFSMNEFMDNMLLDEDVLASNSSNRDFFNKLVEGKSEQASGQAYTYDEVHKCMLWVLASETSRRSYEQEVGRMQSKHRQVLWRLLKEFKIRHPGGVPRMCDVVTRMLHQCSKIRICSPDWDDAQRRRVAACSADSILRFLNMLSQKFRAQLALFKSSVLFVGVVYLMRMGITMQNVILLPRMHELQHLLPIEAHLKCYFKIKCKFITEVENLVKMCIRNLTSREIDTMGFTSVDINYSVHGRAPPQPPCPTRGT